MFPAMHLGEVKGGSKLMGESPTLSRRCMAWGGAGHSAPEESTAHASSVQGLFFFFSSTFGSTLAMTQCKAS